jgi:16S rRNA (adenine1518-N6/adenine1519-N6)-dimethyltransferase
VQTRKRFGQHFLEAAWADKVVRAIDPRPGDRFLEIGPGPGALTLRLAPKVAHLTAVEIDRDLYQALAPQVPPNVTLVNEDFLEFDLRPLGDVRVAGNLPYNLSSPILFKLVAELKFGPAGTRDATVMIQREVADRIRAKPDTKDYGVLSVLIQLHADVEQVLTLPPGAFRPAPKVHSSVLRLTFRPPQVSIGDEAVFAAMVRSVFQQRRKTLGNALQPFASSRGATAAEALEAAGIDPKRRAETLQLAELARLADAFPST